MIHGMFWMAIVDLAMSSFILFTVIVRENIEVVEEPEARAQPSTWKNLSVCLRRGASLGD